MNAKINALGTETEIRTLIDSWRKAVCAKDADKIVAHYANDIVAYDAISQLQFQGADAYRKHWEYCMSACPMQGEMIFDMPDLHLLVDGDVALGFGLVRCGGIDENGEEKASWMRMSAGYRKIDGEWKIVHEHYSTPFDMQSGKALFDLKP